MWQDTPFNFMKQMQSDNCELSGLQQENVMKQQQRVPNTQQILQNGEEKLIREALQHFLQQQCRQLMDLQQPKQLYQLKPPLKQQQLQQLPDQVKIQQQSCATRARGQQQHTIHQPGILQQGRLQQQPQNFVRQQHSMQQAPPRQNLQQVYTRPPQQDQCLQQEQHVQPGNRLDHRIELHKQLLQLMQQHARFQEHLKQPVFQQQMQPYLQKEPLLEQPMTSYDCNGGSYKITTELSNDYSFNSSYSSNSRNSRSRSNSNSSNGTTCTDSSISSNISDSISCRNPIVSEYLNMSSSDGEIYAKFVLADKSDISKLVLLKDNSHRACNDSENNDSCCSSPAECSDRFSSVYVGNRPSSSSKISSVSSICCSNEDSSNRRTSNQTSTATSSQTPITTANQTTGSTSSQTSIRTFKQATSKTPTQNIGITSNGSSNFNTPKENKEMKKEEQISQTSRDLSLNGSRTQTENSSKMKDTPVTKRKRRRRRQRCKSGEDEEGKNSEGVGVNKALFKTELCRTFEELGSCRYGDRCQYAHGSSELHTAPRPALYKTLPCRTFHTLGFCPYGHRCHFIHNNNNSGNNGNNNDNNTNNNENSSNSSENRGTSSNNNRESSNRSKCNINNSNNNRDNNKIDNSDNSTFSQYSSKSGNNNTGSSSNGSKANKNEVGDSNNNNHSNKYSSCGNSSISYFNCNSKRNSSIGSSISPASSNFVNIQQLNQQRPEQPQLNQLQTSKQQLDYQQRSQQPSKQQLNRQQLNQQIVSKQRLDKQQLKQQQLSQQKQQLAQPFDLNDQLSMFQSHCNFPKLGFPVDDDAYSSNAYCYKMPSLYPTISPKPSILSHNSHFVPNKGQGVTALANLCKGQEHDLHNLQNQTQYSSMNTMKNYNRIRCFSVDSSSCSLTDDSDQASLN